jgi:hypothetical protein
VDRPGAADDSAEHRAAVHRLSLFQRVGRRAAVVCRAGVHDASSLPHPQHFVDSGGDLEDGMFGMWMCVGYVWCYCGAAVALRLTLLRKAPTIFLPFAAILTAAACTIVPFILGFLLLFDCEPPQRYGVLHRASVRLC